MFPLKKTKTTFVHVAVLRYISELYCKLSYNVKINLGIKS